MSHHHHGRRYRHHVLAVFGSDTKLTGHHQGVIACNESGQLVPVTLYLRVVDLPSHLIGNENAALDYVADAKLRLEGETLLNTMEI